MSRSRTLAQQYGGRDAPRAATQGLTGRSLIGTAGSAFRRLRERLQDGRNRLLASHRFQRAAAAFPLTRPVSRRRARDLFDLCAGFVYAQVLHACVRLGLLERLQRAPAGAEQLAAELEVPREAMERLLQAATSLRLVEQRSGGRYALGIQGAVLAGLPSVNAMVRHHAVLYQDLADPVALLKGSSEAALARYWPYAVSAEPERLSAEEIAPYSQLMTASQPLVAAELLDAVSLRGARRLLDVGGGEGAFLISAARRWPHIEAELVDLPAVAERAERRFADEGLGDRLRARGGNFLRDALPAEFDLVTLVRIVHDHGDADVLALLRGARAALCAGGRIAIAEPMAAPRGHDPVSDAYFNLYLLAMGQGRPRSPDAICQLLRQAGFRRPRALPARNPLQARVVLAEVDGD